MLRHAFTVIDPGTRSIFIDRGRPGYAHLGVSSSGAADPDSYALANRLVGNDVGLTALEVLLGRLVLHAKTAVRIALTGAPRLVQLNRIPVAMNAPLTTSEGDVLSVGSAGPGHGVGVYTYVAAYGGFIAARALGSASTDLLGGIGPSPLAIADKLEVGRAMARHLVAVDIAPVRPTADPVTLHVLDGPRRDRFARNAIDQLCRSVYTVTSLSSRVAIRLDGAPIERTDHGELASEGTVAGAVQIPPDGQPIVFGPDHPTTGGYPVLAVVIASDLGAAAQAHPGTRISFVRARPRA